MILEIKKDTPEDILVKLIEQYDAFNFELDDKKIIITSSNVKEVESAFEPYILKQINFDSDIQLASKNYLNHTREIKISNDITIGGQSNNTLVIAGPCSIESESQINEVASYLNELNIKVLRGGAYKPRTSPYTFKGLGLDGLSLLRNAADKFGMLTITEVRDSTHVEDVIQHTDIIQIGAKAMYDHGILNACGNSRKPVLLKRGFGTTLQEFVQAAEFILSLGNPDVILCERGIRTFENKTRFTLDLCGVSYLKHYTNLPIILDPSHAMGYAYGVPDLSRACIAMGIDGLIIETHPTPKLAKSDAAQQLSLPQFKEMYESLVPVAKAIGRNII